MDQFRPQTPEELAEVLRQAAAGKKRIRLQGNNTKSRLGGPLSAAEVCVSTSALDAVLSFEPKDLTVSVGAGMPYARFQKMMDDNGVMVPLDPPYAAGATIGGIVVSNCSGPRRRLYGTPRDLVIGMQFATLEGKLVKSGGMVVKNVAGLDMGKLMIGSLGTLAAVATVNFKLTPKPGGSRSFVFEFPDSAKAVALRDRIIRGVLQPAAIDLLNPAASVTLGRGGWTLAVGTAGNAAVLERYSRELGGSQVLEGAEERAFWRSIEEFSPGFLSKHPDGATVRVSVTLKDLEAAVNKLPGAVVARAGNGVCYSHVENSGAAGGALAFGRGALMEYGPSSRGESLNMWPVKDSGFPMMQKIKAMFDPEHLLNKGRLYGGI